jgi:prolyl 4-hydroxylase
MTERARAMVIEALERRYHGRPVPALELVQHAGAYPEFAAAWLGHALASGAGAEELALALALGAPAREAEFARLEAFWSEAFKMADGRSPTSADFSEIARRHGLSVPEPLQGRIEQLWKHILALSDPPAREDNSTPVQRAALPVSSETLEAVRQRALPGMGPASVYGPGSATERHTMVRDSDQAVMQSPTVDWLIASIERLLARAVGNSLVHAEPLVVLRYRTGQQYRWHRDYVTAKEPRAQQELQMFGQRVHTGILYLSDGFEGGETEFREWGLSLRPGRGECLGFSSIDSDGRPDPDSVHRGAPVTSGEKWIATLWFRARRIWNREGLLSRVE